MASRAIPVFWDAVQLTHQPTRELSEGAFIPYPESPARAEAIHGALAAQPWVVLQAPSLLDEALLQRVHAPEYVALIREAWAAWVAEGNAGEALPGCWPSRGRRDLKPQRIQARLGQASFDAGTPIMAHTAAAVEAAAAIGQSVGEAVARGERLVFGLCRPPGHHAGRDYMGGYSYFNNAALAVERLLEGGAEKVAVLDVDYHQGNGTQDLFYERGEVLFCSLHADPAQDFPYFWGCADECGAGPGAGATLNLPLPRGTDWAAYRPALARALETVAGFGAKALIVSYGADTFKGDPISHFRLDTPDYRAMGADIAALGLPTGVVMEGGYAIEALGANVTALLAGLRSE